VGHEAEKKLEATIVYIALFLNPNIYRAFFLRGAIGRGLGLSLLLTASACGI
jgi:hypothetical protein